MLLNITDESIALQRRYAVTNEELIAIIEASIYFNNEYKEHLIEDKFDVNQPLMDVYLLDYRNLNDFIAEYLDLDAATIINILDNTLRNIEDSIDVCCVYDVDIDVINGNYILRLDNKGNALELRYLELLNLRRVKRE